jgi:lysophospholipase L1-like esterase
MGCGGWAPLPGLAAVKAAQLQVAAAEKLGWWDWAEVTGGICRLDALTHASPKLVQDDHIHLTAEGYRVSAERLFERLMRRPGAPPGTPMARAA